MRTRSRLATAAFAFACGAPAPSAPTSPANNATEGAVMSADSLVVTIAPESATVRARQPLRMTVSVRNAGATVQTIQVSSGCYFDYEVLSASGEVLGNSGQMCTQVMGQRDLKPGASFEGVLVWVPGLAGNVSPASGQYSVRGVLLRIGAPVRSAPVTVRLGS